MRVVALDKDSFKDYEKYQALPGTFLLYLAGSDVVCPYGSVIRFSQREEQARGNQLATPIIAIRGCTREKRGKKGRQGFRGGQNASARPQLDTVGARRRGIGI
ncbi:predicted protein [Micromonas commoda]|uniref:Uncharacterized protein n=1 Tax=Micromonas commoda (strain RCC299 / NOUM17 / CCMP2709) TaxID=296587 RepID=C1E4C4_MICCC|nr:predicted protein [Micromonas commoda]ACO63091.1 predicted protein [Micromonas commoda]|eukprot:XP_002501833.1 predicted protein [Micromonas commoda]